MSPDRQQMIVGNLTQNKGRRQRTMNIVAWKQRTSPDKCVHKL